MATSPECSLQSYDGTRTSIDLLARGSSFSSAASGPRSTIAIELRRFHFDKQFGGSLEPLDRLFSSAAATAKSLLLEDCVLSDRVIALAVERWSPDIAKLQTVVVRRCRQLTMTSLMALASLVTANSASLVTLEISSCHLARQAGILLGQSLQSCRALKRLNTSGNNLRDGGLKAVADGLRVAVAESSTLDELDISGNGVTSVGLASLVGIPLRNLLAGDNSVATISSSLITSNPHLETLSLSGNLLSEEGMRELITSALQSSQLTTLRIQNCGFSVENEAFLTKSLLLRSKTTKGCALQSLFVGETPNIDEILDDNDEADTELLTQRFQELQRGLEMRVPGLTVHLLEPSPLLQAALVEDHETSELPSSLVVEPETPGRQVRRELLERTEFMRRHSEELPLSDGDESLVSYVSDKLDLEPARSSYSGKRPPTQSSRHSQSISTVDAESDLLLPSSSISRRTSAAGSFLQHQQHQQTHQFCMSTTLDDVASQFSIDPPPSVLTSNAALQSTDVEYIVSRTIDTMNRNFEQRLTQFLMRMEFQQQEKNASQLQSLAAKVEACERAIPRLEARLDVLADRIATSGAQVVKLQTDWQTKQTQTPPTPPTAAGVQWTPAIQSHVDELVTSRLRASESHTQNELTALRRDVNSVAMATQATHPQAIVDAVSVHLTQFKQEFDANQSTVLRRFTENIAKDGHRVDERMLQLEGKVAHLEGIIQAEQHASLLALEAISEAFTGNNGVPPGSPSPSPMPVAPMPHHHPQTQQYAAPRQPQAQSASQHGYTFTTRPLK